MSSHNLVWCKVSNLFWVGEKLDKPPDEVAATMKNLDNPVVKFFSDPPEYSIIKKPNHMVDYETNKEEHIRKGLSGLKKRPEMLKSFKKDVAEAERRIGGDENIVEKLDPKSATPKAPRTSIVKEIFRTPKEEKKVVVLEKKAPASAPTLKTTSRRGGTPRKSKIPTPQIQNDNKKYRCDRCGFASDRVGAISSHRKSCHSDGPVVTAPVLTPRPVKAAPSTPVSIPERLPSTRIIKPTPKATPISVPKRTQPRKRKLAAAPEEPKEVVKQEILADWSDGDEEGISESALKDSRKKARTSKDLFDSLFQSTLSVDEDTPDKKPPKLDDANATTDRRSDDEEEMDTEDLPLLSDSSAPVLGLEDKEVKATTITTTAASKPEVLEEKEPDLDAQFTELMNETAFKLPEFDKKPVTTAHIEDFVEDVKPKEDELATKKEEKEEAPVIKDEKVDGSVSDVVGEIVKKDLPESAVSAVTTVPTDTEEVVSNVAEVTVKVAPEIMENMEEKPQETPMVEAQAVKTEEVAERRKSPAKDSVMKVETRPAKESVTKAETRPAKESVTKAETWPAKDSVTKAETRPPKNSIMKADEPPSKVPAVKESPVAVKSSAKKVEAIPAPVPTTSAPVYARKSAPKPIEEPEKKTPIRGRGRPSKLAAEVETSVKQPETPNVTGKATVTETAKTPSARGRRASASKFAAAVETTPKLNKEVVESKPLDKEIEVKAKTPGRGRRASTLKASKVEPTQDSTAEPVQPVANALEVPKPVSAPQVVDSTESPSVKDAMEVVPAEPVAVHTPVELEQKSVVAGTVVEPALESAPAAPESSTVATPAPISELTKVTTPPVDTPALSLQSVEPPPPPSPAVAVVEEPVPEVSAEPETATLTAPVAITEQESNVEETLLTTEKIFEIPVEVKSATTEVVTEQTVTAVEPTAAPVVPTSPAPVVPTAPAPVVPTVPALTVPTAPAPVVPTAPAPAPMAPTAPAPVLPTVSTPVVPPVKPAEQVMAAAAPVKKPVATSAPTASALALAQRKQQQQQRGVPAPTPKRPGGRTYPGKKATMGSSEVTQTKPTATVKPTVNVEDDSIIRQALQVQKGTIKSSPPVEQKKEVPVEQVVHLVPVQNPDGSVSYMLLSLNDSDQLKLDQFEGQTAPTTNLEAVYIDKPIDCETLMTTINPSTPSQPQQQIQLQLPQLSQAPSRQPTASQQVKQMASASAAKASTSQAAAPPTQFITTEAEAPQQFIIQQDGQELLGTSTLLQSEDGSFVDLSQLASGDNNIFFMTADGSIIDPSNCNSIDLQQLFNAQ